MILANLPYFFGLCAYILFLFVRVYMVFFLKKKRYSLEKGIFMFTAFIYFSGLVSVTLFPIPVDPQLIKDNISGGFSEENNIIPLKSIISILSNGFITTALIQIGGNLILLFPLGCLIPMLSVRVNTLKRMLILGLLVSLIIESLQFGISQWVGFTYRSFDVDDFLLNTIGAGIGYIAYKYLYPILRKWLDLDKQENDNSKEYAS